MKPCDMTHPVEYASPSLLLTWFASHHPHVQIWKKKLDWQWESGSAATCLQGAGRSDTIFTLC